MPHPTDHVFQQGPFEPIENYAGRHLFGRFVPASEDGLHVEYHVEVHHEGAVDFWAASFLPVEDCPHDAVGAAERHLHRDAVAFAHALIDDGAAPSDTPYRRRAALPAEG